MKRVISFALTVLLVISISFFAGCVKDSEKVGLSDSLGEIDKGVIEYAKQTIEVCDSYLDGDITATAAEELLKPIVSESDTYSDSLIYSHATCVIAMDISTIGLSMTSIRQGSGSDVQLKKQRDDLENSIK